MRIAMIGSGISGLTAAYLLHRHHEIDVFEANGYIGGHTNTVDVTLDGRDFAIDTGFIVHNDWTYPNFIRLLDELDVATQATSMGFSVRCDRTGVEYCGSSLNGLLAQRSNALRPGFYRMLRDILRFNREATAILEGAGSDATVSEYLEAHGYSDDFARLYLLPMGAAIWSCPLGTFGRFPIRFIVEFYHNHGLLSVRNRPTWRVIEGGSRSYVEQMTAGFRDRIHLNTPVDRVMRSEHGVRVCTASGEQEFDEVIFGCHSDQALRILGDATSTERSVLSAFPYNANSALLHTDASVLPRKRRAWAAWNYHISDAGSGHATVTYNMNILQRIESPHTFCVTLNEDDAIDEARVLGRFRYSHPVFTTERAAAQSRHGDVIRANRTSFCGAYWGNGFHEDGVNSALRVCREFGLCLEGRIGQDGELCDAASARPDQMAVTEVAV
ncbi:protoporphyrinogen oxidase [Maioricimonas rarisocia]|uniref:Protoporphyrinogen oxidase n=1 Tax=Maioricimonas rarisocia TaxID=2528026 RepID=A0A517Z6J5_9PLAN|nr:FAD-dependent oxidoreductase [Maioricimonas rarisocia]QDU38085.1 protoporphyrinogen oxidase [Maioricimonas rarisocia]